MCGKQVICTNTSWLFAMRARMALCLPLCLFCGFPYFGEEKIGSASQFTFFCPGRFTSSEIFQSYCGAVYPPRLFRCEPRTRVDLVCLPSKRQPHLPFKLCDLEHDKCSQARAHAHARIETPVFRLRLLMIIYRPCFFSPFEPDGARMCCLVERKRRQPQSADHRVCQLSSITAEEKKEFVKLSIQEI